MLGGFKIWECTSDIANFLVPNLVTEKAVLDLGCGGGLLGILALKLGAEIVHFQDYVRMQIIIDIISEMYIWSAFIVA